MLVAVLAASASYIAVPPAMRLAVPEANPSLYLTLSLGITFPFNVVLEYRSITGWSGSWGRHVERTGTTKGAAPWSSFIRKDDHRHHHQHA